MDDRVKRIKLLIDAISGALSAKVKELIDSGHDPDEVYDACIHTVHNLVGEWLMKSIKK